METCESAHIRFAMPVCLSVSLYKTRINKKFWKELICLLSLNYLKMSFALKPAFGPT
jgi:hypothetical protein